MSILHVLIIFLANIFVTYQLPSPSLGWAPPTKQTAATHPAPIMDLKIYLLFSSILMVIINLATNDQ